MQAIEIGRTKRHINTFAVTAEEFDMNFLHNHGIGKDYNTFEVVVFNEVLYYLDHKQIMTKFSKMISETGLVVISNWFTPSIPYTNKILETIFSDAGKIFNLKDDIIITGPKGKETISARIGLFSLR